MLFSTALLVVLAASSTQAQLLPTVPGTTLPALTLPLGFLSAGGKTTISGSATVAAALALTEPLAVAANANVNVNAKVHKKIYFFSNFSKHTNRIFCGISWRRTRR